MTRANPLITARDAFLGRHPETRVRLGRRQWGLIDAGRGPALLMLPGTLGRADIFFAQIEALKNRLRLIALSYPDSGGIEDWSRDIARLLAELGLSGVSVLGSSLGGYLAQYFCATHPGLVTRLIAANTLADATPVAGAPPYALDLDAVPADTLRAGFTARLSEWAEAAPEQAGLLLNEVEGRIPEAEIRARLKALKHAPPLPPCPLPPGGRFSVESDDDPLIAPPMRAGLRASLRPGTAYRFRHGGHFP